MNHLLPRLYLLWLLIAIVLSFMVGGFKSENITRVCVLLFLVLQIPLASLLTNLLARFRPMLRFIATGTLLASVVEGFHMISKPVFDSLKISRNSTLHQGLLNYALDLALTVPAYLVILWVIWWFINRYQYSFWQYTLIMGLGQVMGDGGIYYFVAAPAMLLFLPYPMSNYHAMNVLPFISVQDELKPSQPFGWKACLAIPALIAVYFVCGAIIRVIGNALGLT